MMLQLSTVRILLILMILQVSTVLWQKMIFHCDLEIQTKLKNPYSRIHLLGQLWICYKLLYKPWKSINNSQLKFIMFYPTKLQAINSIMVERVR